MSRSTTGLPDMEVEAATDRAIRARIEEAERGIAEERVSMRWEGHALGVVRRAAALAGVPYQTYVKQVAFRQALTDL